MFEELDLDTLAALVESDTAGAVEQFDLRCRHKLQGFARREGLSTEDAQDVAQETLASACLQLGAGKFRGASRVSSWLHGILLRQVATHRRKSERRLPSDKIERTDVSTGELSGATTVDPEAHCILQSVLQRLLPEQRLILLLQARAGLTSRELERHLGRPAGTIRREIHEARKRFRELLNEFPQREGRPLLPGEQQ